jgi:hypothetical protein
LFNSFKTKMTAFMFMWWEIILAVTHILFCFRIKMLDLKEIPLSYCNV